MSLSGSHQKMKIPVFNFEESFCVLDEVDEEDVTAKEEGSSQGTAVQSGSLVKPHKSGHNPGLLPQYAIKQIRELLERVGLQPPSKLSEVTPRKAK